jgi:hypothetical protein
MLLLASWTCSCACVFDMLFSPPLIYACGMTVLSARFVYSERLQNLCRASVLAHASFGFVLFLQFYYCFHGCSARSMLIRTWSSHPSPLPAITYTKNGDDPWSPDSPPRARFMQLAWPSALTMLPDRSILR